MECERCLVQHDGNFGSGRFCSAKCARSFSTRAKRAEISKKVSNTLKGRCKIAPRILVRKISARVPPQQVCLSWEDKFPLKDVMVAGSTYPRHSLKKRIIDQKLLPYICSVCGCSPMWRDEPLPLLLDHINGVNNDNRLENLRFVCSNCDSQLPTYKSKNKVRKRG